MGRRRGAKGTASKDPNWVEKAGLAIAAAGVIVAIVALLVTSGLGSGGDNSTTGPAARPGKLAVVDVQAHDLSPFKAGRAYLEVTLHNMSDRLIVIDGAEVNVQRVYKLSRCASQGDILLSHVYGLFLPASAKEGQEFKTALHQQVGPDEADRFRIGLSTKLPESDQTSVYLFVIKIELENDGLQPDLPLGTAVVGLPELPIPGEYYWDSDTDDLLRNIVLGSPTYVPYLRNKAMPCWRSNTAALRGAVKEGEAVSKDLKDLVKGLAEPSLEALE
jgi:hypothetical protein